LFGDYNTPIKLFEGSREEDLVQAYKDSVDRPLPFNIGYKVNTNTINMLYAVKKGVLKFPEQNKK
jgi:hypothetical protein